MSMEQLHSGELYLPTDPAIMEEQEKCLEKLYDFNATRPCRVLRPVGEHDREFYFKNRRIDPELLK